MKPVKVTLEVLEKYRTEVKGNENISIEEAEKKFTRNMQLSKILERENGNRKEKYCVYGSLHFIVDRHNTVVYMKNFRKSKSGWKQKEYMKESLNRMLKI